MVDQLRLGSTAPQTLADNCCVLPVSTAAVNTLIVTLMPVMTVIVEVEFHVGCETLTALTLCVPELAGAVYKPLELTVPTVLFPPNLLSTNHVTLVLLVPVTVAVNWKVCVVPVHAVCGFTVTTAWPATVMKMTRGETKKKRSIIYLKRGAPGIRTVGKFSACRQSRLNNYPMP